MHKTHPITALCRTRLLSILLTIAGASVDLHANKQRTDEASIMVETTDFNILYTLKGALQFTMKAAKMSQYKNGNINIEGNIEVAILSENDEKEPKMATHLHADSIMYNKTDGICLIKGNVQIDQYEDQLTLTTSELSYDIEKEIFFTKAPIRLLHKDKTLEGKGLHATKDLKTYRIDHPHGNIPLEEPLLPAASA